ncbi:multiubiquitin domain-containing protein [Clostridium arbusti]|uniref:multiubiquitin domain-containing protein n=1 Tax=Clostridium arbusti TaxID=1137848 RepID=UPI0002883157|nr:multiubiquitin domain-containing protein [Clostridium arbusti]
MNIHSDVHINEKKYTLDKNELKGLELKEIAHISEKVALYKKIPHKADEEIINSQTYKLTHGEKFFSSDFKEKIKISIDNKKYYPEKDQLTGIELKILADINPSEYKLIREVKHDGADQLIEDNVVYEINNNDEFFSVPKGIQNGTIEVRDNAIVTK